MHGTMLRRLLPYLSLTAVFFGLRLPMISRYLTWDEVSVSRYVLGQTPLLTPITWTPHSPGFIWIYSLFNNLVGASELGFRMGPFIFSFGTLLLLLYLGHKEFPKETLPIHFLPGTLYAVIPVTVNDSLLVDIDNSFLVFFLLIWYSMTLGPVFRQRLHLRMTSAIMVALVAVLIKETSILFAGVLLVASIYARREIRIVVASVVASVLMAWVGTLIWPSYVGAGFEYNISVLVYNISTNHAMLILSVAFWLTLPMSYFLIYSMLHQLRRREFRVPTLIGLLYTSVYLMAGVFPGYPKYLAPAWPLLFLGCAKDFDDNLITFLDRVPKRNLLIVFLGIALGVLLYPWVTTMGVYRQYYPRAVITPVSFLLLTLMLVLRSLISKQGKIVRAPEFIRGFSRKLFILILILGSSLAANVHQIAWYVPVGYESASIGVREAGIYIRNNSQPDEEIFARYDIGYYAERPTHNFGYYTLANMTDQQVLVFLREKNLKHEIRFFAYDQHSWKTNMALIELKAYLIEKGARNSTFYDIIVYELP